MNLKRNDAVKFIGCVLFVFFAGFGNGASADDLTLWYTQPAKQWVEALPIGNGRLGAMVFGGD